ncbi:hypothetical protein TRFO_06157 [Tritrichomonas foetus]|uniref:Uncharacterized protein n=1 Tax=Tritrichomonas foetus TaxID=1144522 RepID=A0A1J4JZY6_9EUKA|nr:hypothetical protein TRFO_06157 [Tritrichomonas foetus]|eukprot:OHT04729.1 hypothetical protein TRFO_06157 [Tritrichomonas foetus]
MSANEAFVKVDFDESALNSRLEETDDRINEHDDLIKELQARLNGLPSGAEMQEYRESLNNAFENQIKDLNNKYENLLNQYNSAMDEMKEANQRMDTRMNDLTEYVENRLQKMLDTIMSNTTQDKLFLSSLDERLGKCEDKVKKHKTKINDQLDNIKSIASAFASFNDTEAKLDKTLQITLSNSVNSVKNNIQRLFDETSRLKDSISVNNRRNSSVSAASSIPTIPVLQQPQLSQMQQTIPASPHQVRPTTQQRPQITQPQVQTPKIPVSPHVQTPKIPQGQTPSLSQSAETESQNSNQDPQLSSRSQESNNQNQSAITTERSAIATDRSAITTERSAIATDRSAIATERSAESSQPDLNQSLHITIDPNSNSNSTLSQNSSRLSSRSDQSPKSINHSAISHAYNQSGMILSPYQNQKTPFTPEKNNVTFVPTSQPQIVYAAPYDLNKVRPYKVFQAHWRDDPILPDLKPFKTIEEVVDHVYQMYPSLQAYLTAMHDKIVENTDTLHKKIDKDLVEKLFDRFSTIIGEIRAALGDLKNDISLTATRSEINGILEDMIQSMHNDAKTAVGRVRCIACGRETSQITGAMTEAEIARALGTNTPNSIVRNSGQQKIGLSFASREGFDSEIIEEPRSKRPQQPQYIKGKSKLP